MKLNLSREHVVQIIIIAIVIFFGFSMLTPLMSGDNNNQNNNQVPQENEEYELFTGQGNVALILKEYSGVIEVDKITNDSKEFIMQGVNDGDVLYFNEELGKVSIVLSDKTKTYEYAQNLIQSDSNITIILKARVYSNQEFDFTTDDGQVITSKVPESEIRVSYPYEIGEMLYYKALVQFYNGAIVGAQLYPLATVEEMEMIFTIDEVSNEYEYRGFFNWRDRKYVRDFSNNLNETLLELGAENVEVNFVSDVTIYANRAIYSEEADLLKERFENIKTINMEKIVFYDNSTETEEEISNYVYNISNGTITLTFSPALLKCNYEFDGEYSEIESVFEPIEEISIKSNYFKEGVVSTGTTTISKGNKTYDVNDIEMIASIPVNKNEGDFVTLLVDATIQAHTISEIKQITDLNFE